MSAMGPIYQPGEEHGYAEPPERQWTDDEMVTIVGPNGSVHEVDRETAAAATALMADIETRMTAAYEQGKEVGRVNGSARLADAQRNLAMRTAQVAAAVHATYSDAETVEQANEFVRVAISSAARCGNGRCYCGGCVL